ncbi:hypothetical protein TNCV_1200331 [Trichonephila clavipes]|uniref:Uncharacterized protein n=1 Tax=Trichonephila clavipes TaxID=2585209 RepID=A0A8X6S459_TRICX|nr:hypothetical protein TNCV_1200331 [Trichonephila clavipes]
MIRLTTSASTIESLIIPNTLTLKSIELSPWSAIVRVFIVTSRFPPTSFPWVLAWVCISEFPTRTSDLSIQKPFLILIKGRGSRVV